MLKRIVFPLSFLAPVVLSATVDAASLEPGKPYFATLGDRQAVIYFVERAEGDEVVVTVAAQSPDTGSSMRSVAILQPGQHQTLSLGGPAGIAPATLDIARHGDAVELISPVVGQHTASN
jgi:hypothetical protein